jgi:hypothetical protein
VIHSRTSTLPRGINSRTCARALCFSARPLPLRATHPRRVSQNLGTACTLAGSEIAAGLERGHEPAVGVGAPSVPVVFGPFLRTLSRLYFRPTVSDIHIQSRHDLVTMSRLQIRRSCSRAALICASPASCAHHSRSHPRQSGLSIRATQSSVLQSP